MGYYQPTYANPRKLRAWLADPTDTRVVRFDWTDGPQGASREQVRRFLESCVMQRCNRGLAQTGRKWSNEYQTSLMRDAQTLQYKALRIRFGNGLLTPEVRARLPHVQEWLRSA